MNAILSRTGLARPALTLTLALAVMLATPCVRAAEVPVGDGGAVEVTVSAQELTRLTMSDGRHIAKVWAVEGAMQAQPDAEAGEIYIRPLGKAPGQVFSFFVRDEFGATYTLAARVADVPSQTIHLKPTPRPAPLATPSGTLADDHLQRIKTLIRGMASSPRAIPPEYAAEHLDQKLRGWDGTQVRLLERWNGASLRGEVWTIRNTSKAELHLDESRFSHIYDDLCAVAIGTPTVPPSGSTEVYLARGR